MKAAIALQCSTGNCVYENTAPPPTPSRHQGFWTVRAQNKKQRVPSTLACFAAYMRCELTHMPCTSAGPAQGEMITLLGMSALVVSVIAGEAAAFDLMFERLRAPHAR
jgi:hypothetical protein